MQERRTIEQQHDECDQKDKIEVKREQGLRNHRRKQVYQARFDGQLCQKQKRDQEGQGDHETLRDTLVVYRPQYSLRLFTIDMAYGTEGTFLAFIPYFLENS